MNGTERVAIGELWLGLAAMYGREIPRAALSLMLNAIADLDAARVELAMNEWVKSSKNRMHPLPGDIRAMVEPVVDIDSAAREIAGRITGAITKFGWCNARDAEISIGEAGWRVVQLWGGWMSLCQNHGLKIDPNAFYAQAREQAKSCLMHTPESMQSAISARPSETEKINSKTASLLRMKEI